MYGKYLNHLISFIVASIEVPFIPSSPAFDGLHDDVHFLLYVTYTTVEVIKEIATTM